MTRQQTGAGGRIRPRFGLAVVVATLGAFLGGCWDGKETEQTGYRGTGMVQIRAVQAELQKRLANVVPEAQPAADPGGQKASEVYKNVQVLGDLTEGEFLRTMAAITEWVAPQEQGCNYCHNPENLAEDSVYAKVVARRMLQMTRHINADWSKHVAETGVTCYTCHRGQPVPAYTWYEDPGPKQALGLAGYRAGQNTPSTKVGLTSLPYDPFTPLLTTPDSIRVINKEMLAGRDAGRSIKAAETTYALMIHMSEALGVNCTFCHNSRAFINWPESTPQRVTAFHGIRMVSDLNGAYVTPLASVIPEAHKGPLGDALKINCQTCHQGVNKPLYGVSMLKDYKPALGGKPGQ